jgi:hypothetical protein
VCQSCMPYPAVVLQCVACSSNLMCCFCQLSSISCPGIATSVGPVSYMKIVAGHPCVLGATSATWLYVAQSAWLLSSLFPLVALFVCCLADLWHALSATRSPVFLILVRKGHFLASSS